MEPGTILGAGVLAGIVGGFWAKIKLGLSKILGLIIITGSLDANLHRALIIYCMENFKRIDLGNKKFSHLWGNLKIFKGMVRLIAAEAIIWSDLIVFTKNKRIIVVYRDEKSEEVSVSFIRFTFNLDTLIKNAVDNYNKRIESLSNILINRSWYVEFCGKEAEPIQVQSSSEVSSPRMPNHHYPPGISDIRLGLFKMVGYNNSDLEETVRINKFLSLLALPPQVDEAIKDISIWLRSRDWYEEKKIPWRRGLLLYGFPGTGKTSLVKALGQEFNLPIYRFDISGMSNYEFMNYWKTAASNAPTIILIEDIDTIFRGRENISANNTMLKSQLTFECLLNCIDGVSGYNGILLIITTNNIDSLDPALGVIDSSGNPSRPGRIDNIIELSSLDIPGRHKIANRILGEYPELIDALIERGEGMTGAQFQELCANKAIKELYARKANKEIVEINRVFAAPISL